MVSNQIKTPGALGPGKMFLHIIYAPQSHSDVENPCPMPGTEPWATKHSIFIFWTVLSNNVSI